MGIITAVSAVGLAAGLAFTGAHVASAESHSATPAASTTTTSAAATTGDLTLPAGSPLNKRVTTFCARVPKLVERAGKAQARIDGSAATKGSLAALKVREAKAKANGHTRIVTRLDKVIARRTKVLAKLPTRTTNLNADQTQCVGLGLPAAGSTPSTGSSSAS